MPRQTILVKDLSTRSVTLYPSRAHVVRDINDVLLKPGINEVEILGLSPTIDENSVQIDGKGAATVVDVTVELVPNPEVFDEVYPEYEDDDTSDGEDIFEDSDDEPDGVRDIKREIEDLRGAWTGQTEVLASAQCRLRPLDQYVRSLKLTNCTPDDVQKLMKSHEQERAEIFRTSRAATSEIAALEKKLKRKENELLRAGKESRKAKAALKKLKEKEKKQKESKKAEKRRAAQYEREEKLRYWPKQVYKVVLQLETNPISHTPTSSRRGSVGSVTLAIEELELAKEDSAEGGDLTEDTAIALSLSYVTREAAWTPRYDIEVSSTQKSAVVVYRTEFINHTSEMWKDAKISFSTSQTSYQGLNDNIPQMNSWKVKLAKDEAGEDGGLLSQQERYAPRSGRGEGAPFNRHMFFGKPNWYLPPASKAFGHHGQPMLPPPPAAMPQQQQQQQMAQRNMMMQQQQMQQQQMAQQLLQQQQQMAQQMQAQVGTTNTSNHALQDHQIQLMLLEQQNKKRLMMARQEEASKNNMAHNPAPSGQALTDYQMQLQLLEQQNKKRLRMDPQNPGMATNPAPAGGDVLQSFDFDSFLSDAPLEFSEPIWEDNGLTTTFEITQPRTLAPGSQTRRHKIASLHAKNIHLSYIAVPKLRSAAFLQAKIRNPSSNVTLLKGSAGVTLDGSYLGSVTLPQVSPSQVFQLSLGVDPGIQISYPKPSTKRSTQGLFTKELAQVYTRNIWLTNSKKSAVDLLVLEQVPLSEDERLKIDITSPRGLNAEGDVVENVGVAAKEALPGAAASTSSKPKDWGSALARLRKGGEVAFTVKLKPSSGCLLKLEYEAKMPTNEHITMA